MCLLCIEIAKGKMTFKEVGRALGEFNVAPEHEKELEEVLYSNYSVADIAKELDMDMEELAEGLAELDLRQFGDVYRY